jgi:hypothetical protein
VTRIEQHFGNAADAGFTAKYIPLLQRDVDVAIAHAAVRQLLSRLRPSH